jgi:hypothetical protein
VGIAPELWNAPVWPHGRRIERRWSHSHLSPLIPFILLVWFRTCRAQLGPNPTLGEVVCTKVLSTSWSTRFQTGASSCPPSVSKTPTHVLRKPYKCTLIPDPRSVVSSSPRQSTQNDFSYRFLPHTRQEPLFPSQHMHHEAQRIYMLTYNIVVGQSRTG